MNGAAASHRAEAADPRGRYLDEALGILNGVLGDYLHARRNGLALRMALLHGTAPVECEAGALSAACPGAMPRVCLLVHGLTETDRIWRFPGEPSRTYATLLARDLGFTCFDLRYNSGRHVSENGEELDRLLEALLQAYPVEIEELVLVGHSMGGLLARSACHAAAGNGHRWLSRLRRIVFLGTPHMGAPMEKIGNAVTWLLRRVPSAHARLVADVASLRSAGVRDMGFANLVEADWRDADPEALLQDRRTHVPWAAGVAHHAAVGVLSASERDLLGLLLGDGLVRVPSAAGRSPDPARLPPLPPEQVRVFPGIGHNRLAHDPRVYQQLRAWCAGGAP